MEKEGGPVNRPPILDGSNYEYWKARMVAFLKALDSRTWKAVIKGWEHPKMLATGENPSSETCKKNECKRYQVHQTKDLEVLKCEGDIEVSTKDFDSLSKIKEILKS